MYSSNRYENGLAETNRQHFDRSRIFLKRPFNFFVALNVRRGISIACSERWTNMTLKFVFPELAIDCERPIGITSSTGLLQKVETKNLCPRL